ncbi:hypothetical protein PHYPSEUDO_006023 [Phytophthora pseudosyringae]|uniref:RxLR effector protein n=1 Tax=Phytophthora pseudosyringae TaxID=221518 RepID=A0A8T1VJJ3_9STRA|nr:hypothetical protein PHYPSEUDO_006023 [Phytophthora pseudosyringae]
MRYGHLLVLFMAAFTACCAALPNIEDTGQEIGETTTTSAVIQRNLKGSETATEDSDEERAVSPGNVGKLKNVFQTVKTKTAVINALKKVPTKISAKDVEIARQFVTNIQEKTKINKKAIAITLLVFLLVTGGSVALANYTRSH